MKDVTRKICVGIGVLLILVLAATGIGWFLAGQIIAAAFLMVVIALPTWLIIKLVKGLIKSA